MDVVPVISNTHFLIFPLALFSNEKYGVGDYLNWIDQVCSSNIETSDPMISPHQGRQTDFLTIRHYVLMLLTQP